MCYNAKRGENMKLAIDAMSGDLGSSIVVEACQSFLNKNKTDELYVVGKIEELEALKEKAKELGIKNAHNMKKETLIAKIEEAKAGEGQNPEGE